jgi:hypothetical protein
MLFVFRSRLSLCGPPRQGRKLPWQQPNCWDLLLSEVGQIQSGDRSGKPSIASPFISAERGANGKEQAELWNYPVWPVVLPRAPNRLENWKGPVPNYLTLRRTPNKMTHPLLKGPAEYAAL